MDCIFSYYISSVNDADSKASQNLASTGPQNARGNLTAKDVQPVIQF